MLPALTSKHMKMLKVMYRDPYYFKVIFFILLTIRLKKDSKKNKW